MFSKYVVHACVLFCKYVDVFLVRGTRLCVFCKYVGVFLVMVEYVVHACVFFCISVYHNVFLGIGIGIFWVDPPHLPFWSAFRDNFWVCAKNRCLLVQKYCLKPFLVGYLVLSFKCCEPFNLFSYFQQYF